MRIAFLHLCRPATLALLLVRLAAVCRADLRSDLLIEPGKQFVLGGGQPGAFKVVARNVGKVPVEIKERPRGGGLFGKTTLAPGAAGTLRFMAGSSAVLLNPSAYQARLNLRVTGDTNLRMTYEPNGNR